MEQSTTSRPHAGAEVTIRPMNKVDAPELLRLMRAIVSFERGQDFRLDEAELMRRGFGECPEFGAYVADTGAGTLIGIGMSTSKTRVFRLFDAPYRLS